MRTVRHPMDPFNSFAMVCAGLVGFMCVALGMIGGSLFFMLIGGGILYAVYRHFNG